MPPFIPGSSDLLDQRLAQVIYRCLEEVGSTKAALYLRDTTTQGFTLAAHYGWPRTQPPPERLAPLDPLLVLVSREKRGFAVNDVRNFRELAPFSQGSAGPRFHISPVYDRGEWRGLLIQRDPAKGGNYRPEQDPAVQDICQELSQALGAHLDAPEPSPVPDLPGTVPEEVPAIRVAAPPVQALVRPMEPTPAPAAGQQLEQLKVTRTGHTDITALGSCHPGPVPEARDPFQDLAMAPPDAFIPEQQTFFWESANLLCQMVPTSAVALWLDDPQEPRPLLVYSRFPLSNDLKHQIVQQALNQLPRLKREELQLLTKSEWFERDPIAGHFLTLLPVLMEEQPEESNLLMLFRLEDRSFTVQEQDIVRQVARMLGFYFQEVRLHERYHRAFLSVSQRILASAEGRLPAMRTHSLNTAELARDLAKQVDLATADVEAVSIAAILHDVGTLLLDYRILDKPRLTPDELAKVRQHPLLASAFLKDLYFPFDVLKIIRHHHEHWDGSGYPDHLRGEDIPMGSRIIHLVEAFVLMISETPYRPAKTVPEAIQEVERLAGVQFDPHLVVHFIGLLGTGAIPSKC